MTARLVARCHRRALSERREWSTLQANIYMPMTIAELNDAFRRNLSGDDVHFVYLTRGVSDLHFSAQMEIVRRVRAFDAFGPNNDPHGEHDFGSFEYAGQSIFWKIDYYDTEMQRGSPDPADPAVTRRVLTIMLAEEY